MAIARDSRNRQRSGFKVTTRLDLLEQDMDMLEGKLSGIVTQLRRLLFAAIGGALALAANAAVQAVGHGLWA